MTSTEFCPDPSFSLVVVSLDKGAPIQYSPDSRDPPTMYPRILGNLNPKPQTLNPNQLKNGLAQPLLVARTFQGDVAEVHDTLGGPPTL